MKKTVSIAVLDYSTGAVEILENVSHPYGDNHARYLDERGYDLDAVAYMVNEGHIEVAVTDTTNNSTSWIL